ncbi:MAG: hypothetical protein H6708_31805 [Kofleriaceae bacterium]|nr:hypothetical protein [Kofleriaceae bacterium]
MRSWLAALLTVTAVVAAAVGVGALGGCHLVANEASDVGDDGAVLPGGNECYVAADCAAAASSCCGCADFAVPGDSRADGCEDVMCPEPPPGDCPAVAPACVDGFCTLACVPVTCDMTCADGFAADVAGCLVCACAEAPAPGGDCAVDDDCVEVAADCCGCGRGGADTAVPVDQVATHDAELGCPADPTQAACPEVDVCDPAAAPRCAAGRCTLGAGPPTDGLVGLCGRPDLEPCPAGTACVLNADSDAAAAGLGTCLSP